MKQDLIAWTAYYAIALCALYSTPAVAQTSQADGTDAADIVVTAQRRAENLQDVPVSIQVASGETLSKAGVTQLSDIEKVSPSIVVNNVTSNVNAYIRGVGSTVQGSGFSPSVAIYVDGVYVSRLTSGSFDLDNIEQLQVLKGPQGALYGRSATGGAIVISTKTSKVGDPLSVTGAATHGNYNRLDFSGRISGSLGDNLAFSINAAKNNRDGFIKNLTPAGLGFNTANLDDRDSFNIASSLVFEPSDWVSFVLRGSYFEATDRNSMAFQPVGLNLTVPPFGLNGTSTVLAGTMIQFGLPVQNALTAAAGFTYPTAFGQVYDIERNGYTNGVLTGKHLDGQFNHLEMLTAALTAKIDLGGVELTAISAYSNSKSDASVQVIGVNPATLPAGFNGGSIGFSGDLPSTAYTNEIQLASKGGKTDWVVGVYWLKEDGSTDLTGDLFGLSRYSARNDWNVNSISAYAQATVPFTDRLSLTLGGRYTDESFKLNDRYNPLDPLSISPLLPNFSRRQQDSSQFTYTARLNYDTGPVLVYGGISTGFKAGTLSAINPSSPGVSPEKITSYEIGIKSEPARGVTLNLAGFYYDYQNIHIAFTDTTSGASLLVNGTGGRVYGADLDFSARANDWLRVTGGVTVLDTKYDRDVVSLGNTVALGGKRLVGAPNFSAAFGAELRAPWIDSGDLVLSGSFNYNGGYFFDGENKVGTGGITADGYTTASFNVSYQLKNERWKIELWAINAFNEQYYKAGITQGFINRQVIPASPQQYGVTLRFKF